MWFYREGEIDKKTKEELMKKCVEEIKKRIKSDIKKVLLLPPDKTRYHSGAGELTNILYKLFCSYAEVHVIPTLGQHVPHTPKENKWMFPDIPQECFYNHDWRKSNTKLGEIREDFVEFVSDNCAKWSIPVEINSMVVQGGYDVIINIGQVVPHEVLGFANHNKNYFIGLGSKDMICASHIMAASCGIENNLGQLITPLRACYNLAENQYLSKLPDVYILITMKREKTTNKLITGGIYVGEGVDVYLEAAKYSFQNNITIFEKPVKKIVAVMDKHEFNSTWVANKAIYRTRMALQDGGELIIIAEGVERFGEQEEVDRVIRKYGYKGTEYVLTYYQKDPELQNLGHAAAHLIHGSSEGRFTITYATNKLSQEEIESVGYRYMSVKEAITKYHPEKLQEGFNTVDGEEIFFISSPSLGLWASKEKFIMALENNQKFVKKMIEKYPAKIWSELKSWNESQIEKLKQ